jgi:hypothetical protein
LELSTSKLSLESIFHELTEGEYSSAKTEVASPEQEEQNAHITSIDEEEQQ